MELDNIKELWKQLNQQQAQKDAYNDEAIYKFLAGESRGVIAVIRKNLRLEMVLTAIIMLSFVVLPFIYEGELLQTILGVWALLSGVYMFFYLQKYKIIQAFDSQDKNLKNNLQTLVTKLEKYTSIYFWSNVVLIPLVHITNFILLRLLNLAVFHNLQSNRDIFFYLIYVVVVSAIMIYFFYWYIQRMYGKYIEKLRGYLNDLETNGGES